MIVGFSAGGPTDAIARRLAPIISKKIGKNLIIENKAGAAGMIAGNELKRSSPDGNTILFAPLGITVLAPIINKNTLFKFGEFTPISRLFDYDLALSVNAATGIKSLNELSEFIKKDRSKANFGSSGVGTMMHFAGELFSRSANLNLTHIPYKGAAPAINGLLGNEITFTVGELSGALDLHRAGRINIVATLGNQRNSAEKEIRFAAEQGFKDINTEGWYAVYGPPGMAKEHVDMFNQAFHEAIQELDKTDVFSSQGLRPHISTPGELQALEKFENIKWSKIISDTKFST